MTKLGFILKTSNRLRYIIEVLMERAEKNRKSNTYNMKKLGFVFCIQNKPLSWFFPKYFLYCPIHSDKFVFIISDFPSHLFSFLSFFFFFILSTAIKEKECKKEEKQVAMTPLDTPLDFLPGVTAPHESALLHIHLQGERARGGGMH